MTSGFLESLTLLFVAAKLFGFIHWSWWLVFSPVLIGAGAVLLFCVAVFLFGLIAAILS